MASSKDLKPLLRSAEKQGWTISRTRGDHLKWTHPDGGMPYFSSSTPGDSRAVHNIRKDLMRRGLRS